MSSRSPSSCSSERRERELEIVEDVERHVVPGGDSAEHEPCDRAEWALARERDRDLIHSHRPLAGPRRPA